MRKRLNPFAISFPAMHVLYTRHTLIVVAMTFSLCLPAGCPALPQLSGLGGSSIHWEQYAAQVKPAIGTAAAFDSRRGVIVVAGGWSNQTWEWDGEGWSLRTTNGPSSRAWPGVAYDEARGVTVLFGGQAADGTTYSDTWEWDDSSWTASGVSGPAPHAVGAMVYDAARRVTVLVGGKNASDTWEYDGSTWTQRVAAGSPEGLGFYNRSSGHAAVYEALNLDSGVYDDSKAEIWEWDGMEWTKSQSLNFGLGDPAVAFDDSTESIVLAGGTSLHHLPGPEPMYFLGGNATYNHPQTPANWYQFNLVSDRTRGELIGFGGYFAFQPSDTTWRFRDGVWTQAASSGPTNRSNPYFAYDTQRSRVVELAAYYASETWELRNDTWLLRPAAPQPPIREHGAMTYDSGRGVCVLFGGRTVEQFAKLLSDVWEWNGESWTQVNADGPSARVDHALTYDPVSGLTYLFGGADSNGLCKDLWSWDGSSWKLLANSGPSQRSLASLAPFPPRKSLLMVGGVRDFSRLNETWEWNGRSWAELSSTEPPVALSMVYDESRKAAMAIGAGTWSWNGVNWTQISDEHPGGTALFDTEHTVPMIMDGDGGWWRGMP